MAALLGTQAPVALPGVSPQLTQESPSRAQSRAAMPCAPSRGRRQESQPAACPTAGLDHGCLGRPQGPRLRPSRSGLRLRSGWALGSRAEPLPRHALLCPCPRRRPGGECPSSWGGCTQDSARENSKRVEERSQFLKFHGAPPLGTPCPRVHCLPYSPGALAAGLSGEVGEHKGWGEQPKCWDWVRRSWGPRPPCCVLPRGCGVAGREQQALGAGGTFGPGPETGGRGAACLRPSRPMRRPGTPAETWRRERS